MKSNLGLPASLFSLFQYLLILVSLHPTFQSFINSEEEMEITTSRIRVVARPFWGLWRGCMYIVRLPCLCFKPFCVANLEHQIDNPTSRAVARPCPREGLVCFHVPYWISLNLFLLQCWKVQYASHCQDFNLKSCCLPSFHWPQCNCFNRDPYSQSSGRPRRPKHRTDDQNNLNTRPLDE